MLSTVDVLITNAIIRMNKKLDKFGDGKFMLACSFSRVHK